MKRYFIISVLTLFASATSFAQSANEKESRIAWANEVGTYYHIDPNNCHHYMRESKECKKLGGRLYVSTDIHWECTGFLACPECVGLPVPTFKMPNVNDSLKRETTKKSTKK